MAALRKIPAPKVTAGTVVAAEPDNVEVQQTSAEGTTIAVFMRSLVPFFTKAAAIEKQARETLALAKSFKRPRTMDEDESMQRFLKTVTADTKTCEAHWEITAIVSRFHKRLTAARKRATDPLDEAKTIANGHHNAYVETERQRVAQEQERLRREAEEKARIDRERDLAKQEEDALQHELALDTLSARELNFVNFYVLTIYETAGNAAAALRRAGYKNPDQIAPRMMATPKIVKAIEAKRNAEAIRAQASALREQPLSVETRKVTPQISRAAGGHERTTWTGEVLDAAKFIDAAFDGGHGIPRDVLMVSPVKLNEYARSLEARLDLWPGVRAKKSTTFV